MNLRLLIIAASTLCASLASAQPAFPPGTPAAQQTLVRRTYCALPHGDHAYLCSTIGVVVVDIKDPRQPRYVGLLRLKGSVNGLALVHGKLVAALGPDGLVVADLGNRERPKKVGALRVSGAAMDVAGAGKLVYVASGTAGVQVVDISDPARPRKIGHVETPGHARHVAVGGDVVYVADGRQGLRIFRSSAVKKTGRQRLQPLAHLAIKRVKEA